MFIFNADYITSQTPTTVSPLVLGKFGKIQRCIQCLNINLLATCQPNVHLSWCTYQNCMLCVSLSRLLLPCLVHFILSVLFLLCIFHLSIQHICYSVCLCKFEKWIYEILYFSHAHCDAATTAAVDAESWARHKFIQHLLCGTNKMIINKLFIQSQVCILH